MADFLRLIDTNAGGLRLKKGQGILHLTLDPCGDGDCLWDFYGGNDPHRGSSFRYLVCGETFGNGPNTVSGSTVSNTELSEFFGAH